MDPAFSTATPQKLRQAFLTKPQGTQVPHFQKHGISPLHDPLTPPATRERKQGSLYGLQPTFGWDCPPFSPAFGPPRFPRKESISFDFLSPAPKVSKF